MENIKLLLEELLDVDAYSPQAIQEIQGKAMDMLEYLNQ